MVDKKNYKKSNNKSNNKNLTRKNKNTNKKISVNDNEKVNNKNLNKKDNEKINSNDNEKISKYDSEKLTKKNKNTIIMGIFLLIIILLGSAYAFFTYSKTGQSFTLTSKFIKAEFIGGTNSINITNAYPISDEFAIQNLDKLSYLDFTVTSTISNPDKAISYELYLTGDTTNTLDGNYIKVYLTDESNNKLMEPKIYNNLDNTTYSSDKKTGKVIYVGNTTGTNTNKFRLYAWIDKDYEQNSVSQKFKFNVNIYAYNDNNKNVSKMFLSSLKEKQTDSCKTYLEEDGITYVSGTRECINFNYVWYSGKLWRITAINDDGTVKMITEDYMTNISYETDTSSSFYDVSKKNNASYTGSYMYQWLNEDFLNTLYNNENMIVENSTWNITQTTDIATKLASTNVINNATINKNTPVGLLNTYEYYLSYKNTTEWYSYLSNNNTIFWLLNPYSSTQNWCVNDWTHDKSAPTQFLVVRPVINLKANVAIKSGDGTVNNPYKLIGDKEDAKANTTLINTRNSGEYVKFNDELYRIVNIENKKTKIIKYDYVKNGTDIVLKKFGTDVNYGNGDSDDYADYYLNNTWYNSLTTSSKNLLENNNYYLGESYYGQSYKNSICITKNTIETIKSCQKTTSIWNGKIGLPRLGEMFASQDSVNGTNAIWIITKAGDSIVWNIEPGGYSNYNYPNATYAIRPSIYLKSNIVITNGDGTRSNPFEIALK